MVTESNYEKESQQEVKELKEDLNNLERYIEELSEFLPLPFCAVNPINIIIDTNKALKQLIGYEEKDLVGEKIEGLFKDKSRISKAFNNALKGEMVRNKGMRLLTKKDEEIPVNVSTAARKDREGNVIGVFVAMFDISDIKQYQEKLKEKTKELEKTAKELMKRDLKLTQTRDKREEELGELQETKKELEKNTKKLQKRTKELEEAKNRLEESEKILKIKVRARTRELRELNESLERKVQKRTEELKKRKEELQDRVNELEKFHNVTVGRELKMIKLKKENERLKKEVGSFKKSRKASGSK